MSEMQNSDLCNLLFYPNVCHVCKEYKNIKLYTCCECGMISYCNKTHQVQHWHRHKEICKAIKYVLGDKKHMNTDEITSEEWDLINYSYAQRVADKLQRTLYEDEVQMFGYTKACVVCYRQDVVAQCHDCPGVNFCVNHKDKTEHQLDCKLMCLAFTMAKFDIVNTNIALDKGDVIFTSKKSFHDMRSFINIHVKFKDTHFDKTLLEMQFSEYMTGPLTLYYVLKKLDYPPKHGNMVVHFIAPTKMEIDSILQWKILFHLWHPLDSLTITMVGINLKETKSNMLKYHTNTVKNKRLFTKFHSMSYHDYMRSKDFEKPNFIVGFNAMLYDSDKVYGYFKEIMNELLESTGALPEQSCPLILSFDTLYLKKETLKVECSFYEENPFASLTPRRHSDRRVIPFRNKWLMVFNQLKSNLAFTTKYNTCGLFL